MKTTIKAVAAAMLLTTGLVGCGDMEDSSDSEATDDVTSVTSAFTSAECSTKVINRGNETATKAIVGNLVSITDLTTGVRGDYSKNASIYCNNANGDTKFVLGLIRAKYLAKGAQTFIGYPTTDEVPTLFGDGRFNFFQSGLVLWKGGASEAFEIHGAIRTLYAGLGSEWGEMGFAQSDETAISGSRRRNIFEFGRILLEVDDGRVAGDVQRGQLLGQARAAEHAAHHDRQHAGGSVRRRLLAGQRRGLHGGQERGISHSTARTGSRTSPGRSLSPRRHVQLRRHARGELVHRRARDEEGQRHRDRARGRGEHRETAVFGFSTSAGDDFGGTP